MDDGVVEAPCTLEGCRYVRDNLRVLLARTKKQTNELQNFSKVQAENETIKMKLVAMEDTIKTWTEKATAALNGKETAEAELKQIQASSEFHRKKCGLLQEQADEAEKHKEQAIHWRGKYDSICALTEKLEANNIDVKTKYEATVKTLETVGKRMLSHQNTITTLKAEKADNAQKMKKLDKYLKSAIQIIDSLSQSTNLNRQPKLIRDLVDVFRKDDVRLYFNSEPFKTTASANADDSDDAGPSSSVPGPAPKKGRTLSDDDEEVPEEVEEEDERAIRKLEKLVTTQAQRTNKRPDFVPKMLELKARKGAPKLLKAPQITNKWPIGVKKPEVQDSGSLLNSHSTHTKTVPTSDFDVISNAVEARKKALLGAQESGATSSTIHGKKGKTVREQQLDMMKKETVKEKVARMRAEAAGETVSLKVEQNKKTEEPEKEPEPKRTRYQSFRMSERGSDDSEEEEQQKPPRRGRGRPRGISVSSRAPTPPRGQSREVPQMTTRRSSRLSTRSSEVAETSVTPSRTGRPRTRSVTSRTSTRSCSSQRSHSTYTATTRGERARARSVLRGDEEAAATSSEAKPQEEKKEPNEEKVEDVVRRNLGISTKKRAAPAPIASGPPLRTRGMERMKAPIVNKKNIEKTPAVPGPSEEQTSLKTERTPAGADDKKVTGPLDDTDSENDVALQMDVSSSSSDSDDSDVIIMPPETEDFEYRHVAHDEALAEFNPNQGPPELVQLDSSESDISVDKGAEGCSAPEAPKEPGIASEAAAEVSESQEAPKSSNLGSETPKSLEPVLEAPEAHKSVSEGPELSKQSLKASENSKPSSYVPKDPETAAGDTETVNPLEPVFTTPEVPKVDSIAMKAVLTAPEDPESSQFSFKSPGAESSPKIVLDVPKLAASSTESPKQKEAAPKAPELLETPKLAPNTSKAPESIPKAINSSDDISKALDFSISVDVASETPKPIPVSFTNPKPATIPPKSPKQMIVCKYGLDISDSEEEEEEDLKIVEESSDKKTSGAPKVIIPSEAEVPKPVIVQASEAPDAPQTSKPSVSIEKATETFKLTPTPKPPIMTRVTSSTASSSTFSSRPENWNSHDELIAKVMAGDTEKKKTPALKSRTSGVQASTKHAPPTRQAPPPKKENDLFSDILSGAKAPSQKPRVQKRVTPSAKTPQATLAPSTSSSAPIDDVQKTQKRQASSTEENPPAKRQYIKKPVKIIDAVPLKRGRSVTRNATSSQDPPALASSEEPTTSSVVELNNPGPATSAEKEGGAKAILIEARTCGRNIKMEKPMGLKEAMRKSQEKGGKKVNKLKALLRQALDLKVPPGELKRLMEERGVPLGTSIQLSPSDAVDVMMEFLRESAASDMWAVLHRQRIDANLMPLMNTEEQNFLNVSVTLNDNDQLLLELFISRVLYEISLRDSIDSKQCGRLVRLFCHAIRFTEVISSTPEDSEDPEAFLHEKKAAWMKALFMILLHKHPTQLIKSLAYCLISDSSDYCHFIVEELEKNPLTSDFHFAFRILLHKESEQAGVVNWLLNSKFQMAYTMSLTPDEITMACEVAHRKFIENDLTSAKSTIFLAKTAAREVLGLAFKLLEEQMNLIERQFLEPKDKEKELKHKTVFSVPTITTKMSAPDAATFKKEAEWQKTVLLIMIDNPTSQHYRAIMDALTKISEQVVAFREIVDSSDVENFVDPSGVDSLREAVQHLLDLISEFTNYPLKPSILPNTTTDDPSTSSNATLKSGDLEDQ